MLLLACINKTFLTLFAGRFFFIVSATNAAGGDGVSSAPSSELLVGACSMRCKG